MSSSILESIKPSYSIIISKDEYYKLKDYIKRFCTTTSEYKEDDGYEYKEALFFICNKVLFVLIYEKLLLENEEIYSLYRPF